MADLAAAPSPPPPAVLPVLFVDGDRTVDLVTVTVQPSLGVKKLQALVADRVGVGFRSHVGPIERPARKSPSPPPPPPSPGRLPGLLGMPVY